MAQKSVNDVVALNSYFLWTSKESNPPGRAGPAGFACGFQ
jgi:hypothetical protein